MTVPFLAFISLFLLQFTYGQNLCTTIGILGEYKRATARTIQPLGVEIKRGVDFALDDIKENKPCLKIVTLDIENSVANIPDVIRKANKELGIKYFLGLGTSDQALAAVPALQETNSILLTPTASSDDLLKDDSRTVLMFPRNSLIAEHTANELIRRKIKGAGIIYASNNKYSVNMAQVFSKLFKQAGGKILYEIPIRSGRFNLTKDIELLKKYKDDFVFLPLYELDVAKVITYFHSNGLTHKLIGTDSWGTYSVVIRKVTKDIPYKAILPIIYSAEQHSELNDLFVKRYKKKFDSLPSDLTAFSYEALRLYQKMLAICKSDRLSLEPQLCFRRSIPYQGIAHLIKNTHKLNINRPIEFMEHINLAE